LNSVKKESSISSSLNPTQELALEQESPIESYVAEIVLAAAALTDVIVETKPEKPKRKRSQPKAAAYVPPKPQKRKSLVKLPKQLRFIESIERLKLPTSQVHAAKPLRRNATRLPVNRREECYWQAPLPSETAMPLLYLRRPVAKLPSAFRSAAHWQVALKLLSPSDSALPMRTGGATVNIERIVEAILFAANRPMTVKQIQQVFPELEQPDTQLIQEALVAINQDYLNRPIGLKQLASGYRFQVKEGMADWVSRLFEEKPARYSRAALETLAIIAYRQPVTRGDIEDIRGVSVSSGIIQSLLEREWIRVIAHKEVPGRPALFGTTKQFLDYFNLSALNELPSLEALANLDFDLVPTQQPQQDHSERPQTDSSAAPDHSDAEQ
jgi:segregation and condensation protein B